LAANRLTDANKSRQYNITRGKIYDSIQLNKVAYITQASPDLLVTTLGEEVRSSSSCTLLKIVTATHATRLNITPNNTMHIKHKENVKHYIQTSES